MTLLISMYCLTPGSDKMLRRRRQHCYCDYCRAIAAESQLGKGLRIKAQMVFRMLIAHICLSSSTCSHTQAEHALLNSLGIFAAAGESCLGLDSTVWRG